MRSKLEFELRKDEQRHMDMFELSLVTRLSKNLCIDMSEDECKKADMIAYMKNLDIHEFAYCMYIGDTNYRGMKHYNATRRSIKECFSKEQWTLLKRYFSCPVDDNGVIKDVRNIA